MTRFLQNKVVRILGLIFFIVFLPFIPISFLIYKAHNKFSGLTKILIIAPLVIVFLLSFIWSWAIFLPSKSENLQVETSKNTLFIGTDKEIPKDANIIDKVLFPNKMPAFVFAKT